LTPLGLLMLVPLHLVARRRGLRAALTARPAAVVVLVVYGAVLVSLAYGSMTVAGACWRTKPVWWGMEGSRSAGFRAQAAAIDRLCAPEERIYVWGWSPGTYRYARRLPASRHATLEKLGQVGIHAQFIFDRATEDIQRGPPCVLLMSPNDYDRLGRGDDAAFAAWLRAHYEIIDTVNGMHILQSGGRRPASLAD
jgi:hypothetical protein